MMLKQWQEVLRWLFSEDCHVLKTYQAEGSKQQTCIFHAPNMGSPWVTQLPRILKEDFETHHGQRSYRKFQKKI